jgi:hypothetical protein
MAKQKAKTKMHGNINGWGADLAPENRPGIPRELNQTNVLSQPEYKTIERQVPPHRIHMTVERDRLTPVFGTSCPPRLLSGLIRDVAYKYSEARLARWMTLLVADRVDIVESSFIDLLRFKWPRNRYFYGVLGLAGAGGLFLLYRRRKPGRLPFEPALKRLVQPIWVVISEGGFSASRPTSHGPASFGSADPL